MATVFLRTVIIYVFLLVVLRLMGKRQVGELEVSELITTLMLSEIAVVPITDWKIPILYAVVPAILLVSIEVILSFITFKSSRARKILLGDPCVIISKGILQKKSLEKMRMSTSELMSEMRLKGISSLSDVECAIIEDNGQISVFQKERPPATPFNEGDGVSVCVVRDGRILWDNLALCEKNEEWLLRYLHDRGIELEHVCLMTVGGNGQISTILNRK